MAPNVGLEKAWKRVASKKTNEGTNGHTQRGRSCGSQTVPNGLVLWTDYRFVCSNHYVACFEPWLVPLSKVLYHTCFICGQRCKCWSRWPKLTSLVISNDKPIIYNSMSLVQNPQREGLTNQPTSQKSRYIYTNEAEFWTFVFFGSWTGGVRRVLDTPLHSYPLTATNFLDVFSPSPLWSFSSLLSLGVHTDVILASLVLLILAVYHAHYPLVHCTLFYLSPAPRILSLHSGSCLLSWCSTKISMLRWGKFLSWSFVTVHFSAPQTFSYLVRLLHS